jgi:predicted helicase
MKNIDELKQSLENYHKNVKDKYKSAIANEHTLRTDFEILLNNFKSDDIKIFQEAKKEEYENGVPDFKVFRGIDPKESLSYNLLIGYIETKKLDENLNKIVKTEQIKKYLEVSPNIIVTNYNKFIHLSYDKKIDEITLFPYGLDDNLFSADYEIDENLTIKFRDFLNNFFLNYETRKIKTKKELVKVLSSQAFYLSVKTREVITNNEDIYLKFKNFFKKTYNSFKETIKYKFSLEEFCDIFAQSIAYGLFVAHIEGINIEEDIDLPRLLPKEFDLLAEFIYFSAPSFNIPKEIEYTIENIKRTITLIDIEKVEKELDNNNLSIYLYEDFLKEFDTLRGTEKRKEGGVFYTPEPVVKFIVKSVKNIIKNDFNLNGFKDDNVKVLDPATGTGSFLAEVFNSIIEDINSPVLQKETVRKYFLNNIYGFELMFVPYIVAHLKLSHILKNKGYTLNENERLNIFLTNTLDFSQDSLNLEMPLLILEEENEKSRKIKQKEEVLVIVGNPPYNNKSKNRDEKILELLNAYKTGLNEKKINLDDDYIKFIRFAQWKLLEQNNNQDLFSQKEKRGILSFITNNSFIWGRTHRKMRESLYNSFDEIYILNLHGGKTDPKEDKNVFDIQIGVCISIFIKHPQSREKKVYYYSTADNNIFSREDKFNLLNNNTYKTIEWKELEIKEPYYWFIDKNLSSDEYEIDENFWGIDKIFKKISVGIGTKVDSISIDFNKNKLAERINYIIENKFSFEKLKDMFFLNKNCSWEYNRALKANFDINKLSYYHYRPFDIRYVFFDNNFLSRSRISIMNNFFNKNNMGLVFSKTEFSAFISDKLSDEHLASSKSYIAPLYLYHETMEGETLKESNFTNEFQKFMKTKPYSNATPEKILAYMYAILYHSEYRTKYLEYLKIDYPKIPFTDDLETFNKLSKIGEELIELHLMKQIPKYSDIKIDTNDDNYSLIVEKLTSKNRFKDNKIFINKTLFVDGVDEDVWNYKIGGYQVIDKWIKYRIGRELDLNELQHLENIVKIIKKTIKIQKKLEKIKIN